MLPLFGPGGRLCPRCGTYQPLMEFHWRNRRRGTRQSICRACRKEVSRDWYMRLGDDQRARVKVLKDAARARNAKLVNGLKDNPCTDCGVKYPPYVMDFDHVRGEKLGDIGDMVGRGTSVANILAEIAKCELVCSNCHRERTFRRLAARRAAGRTA